MSNVNNQFKELINEAIHSHFHDKTETEVILKDWLHGICEQLDEYEVKAKAWDLLKLKLSGVNKSILSNPKASDEDLDFAGNNTAVLWEMSDLEMKFRKEHESSEADDSR